jgi:hypothetical protein
MPDKFIVSIHIPKTAGTTLATIYDRAFNRNVFYDYDGYQSAGVASELVKANAGFISSQFDVLHGHFFTSKYLNVFPNARYVALLRHPVERLISQYIHELNEASSDAWYHDAIVRKELDIVDFAGLPEIRNTMTVHLSGLDLKDYDLLMINERLLESCWLFSKNIENLKLELNFGKPIKLPYVNQKMERDLRPVISKSQRQAIFNCLPEDVETYEKAKEIFEKQLSTI